MVKMVLLCVFYHNKKHIKKFWSDCLLACLVALSCPTLWDPMDGSPLGSSVHGIFQVRILEWIAISFSRDLPGPGIEPVSPALQVDSLPAEPSGKPLWWGYITPKPLQALISGLQDQSPYPGLQGPVPCSVSTPCVNFLNLPLMVFLFTSTTDMLAPLLLFKHARHALPQGLCNFYSSAWYIFLPGICRAGFFTFFRLVDLSSLTKGWTHAPAVESRSPNFWTTSWPYFLKINLHPTPFGLHSSSPQQLNPLKASLSYLLSVLSH